MNSNEKQTAYESYGTDNSVPIKPVVLSPEKRRSNVVSLCGRSMSLLTVVCFAWSFTAFPAVAALRQQAPPKPVPHSLWMSSQEKSRLTAQVAKLHALQSHVKPRMFNYVAANAHINSKPLTQRTTTPQSILDDVGQLAYLVPATLPTQWNHELLTGHPTRSRSALLHVWLGEWQLAAESNPEAAIGYFEEAQRLSRSSESVYGMACYDRSISLYDEGAYRAADESFSNLLAEKPRLSGFSLTSAALWLRHAGACAGYHADRSRAGIPEPARLDPECGAAALASSLHGLGKPYDRKTVLSSMRVTGEGSNAVDIVNSAKKMGLNAWGVRADDEGLILLPKPLVAYVEHDHFVSVVSANNRGVSYLCSDCGPWPGGPVNLNWKQWHLLEGGFYVVATKPGSASDRELALLRVHVAILRTGTEMGHSHLGSYAYSSLCSKLSGVRVAFVGLLTDLHLTASYAVTSPVNRSMYSVVGTVKSVLYGHVYLDQGLTNQSQSCGVKTTSNQCPDALVCPCPTAGGGPGDSGGGSGPYKPNLGPANGDPVNLATGEEEYTPGPDLTVYNPVGPQVTWQRTYDSLRNFGQGFNAFSSGDYSYEMNDYGIGWSQKYNVGVADSYPSQTGASYPKSVYFDNGAHIQFILPSIPSSSNPKVLCQNVLSGGVPFLIYADYGINGNYYNIVWRDRTQWFTKSATTINLGTGNTPSVYPLGEIADRNGNYITFNYGLATGAQFDYIPLQWPLLSSISNQNGTALLTIVRDNDGSGSIASVYDCYDRSVLYHVSETQNYDGVEFGLDHVSQIVSTGVGNPPDRYNYGYQNGGQGYCYLHAISVPSPTGTGISTATINYDPTFLNVTSIVDGNGNKTVFKSVSVTGTSGGTGAPGSSTPPLGVLTATEQLPNITTNYCQVQYEKPDNTVINSFIAGYDMNMSYAIKTDGTGRVTMSKAFSATSPDPYEPTTTSDGNGNTTTAAWDAYGNMTTFTTARGTVSNYSLSYANFSLGELMSRQEGSKTPTRYTYFEPSGLLSTATCPLPGTSGTNQTYTCNYTWDTFGNPLVITGPGNNATATSTLTFNYTSDGSFSQPTSIGQELTETDNLGNVKHYRYDSRGNKR